MVKNSKQWKSWLMNKAKILEQAVALTYEHGEFAPRVLASGKGLVAEQIIAKAKEHDIYIHESKDLVGLLMQVDLDENIPPALYQAVAEILAWLYQLERQ